MLESPGCFAVVLLVGCDRLLEIVTPQVADRRHFHIFFVFEQRHYAVELPAAIPDTDVPQRDSVVSSSNARIRQRRAAQGCTASRHNRAFLQDLSSADLTA